MDMNVTAAPSSNASLAKHAALILALWLGFWLIALGLVALLLWIPVSQVVYRGTLDVSSMLAGLGGLTLAWALRPRRSGTGRAKQSVENALPRSSALPLYALAEKIGAQLGIVAPVRILLMSEATAFIVAERNWYGMLRSLEVGIGLPLLANLSREELGAVIGHEFGHFVAGDLALGPWVHRTRLRLALVIADMEDSMFFFDLLFKTYGALFLRLSAGVSRAQEFAADAAGAQVCGAGNAVSALVKVHHIGPVWTSYLMQELLPAVSLGARVPILAGYRAFAASPSLRDDVRERIDALSSHSASLYDSHPSLDARITALARVGASLSPGPADCLDLLGGEAAAEAAWYQRLRPADVAACTWARVGPDFVQPAIVERFAGTWMDPHSMPLAELTNLTQDLDAVWQRLRPGAVSFLSPAARRHHVLAVLRDWIVACLVAQGFALRCLPGQALFMRRGRQKLEPGRLLQAALDKAFDSEMQTLIARPSAVRALSGTPPLNAALQPDPDTPHQYPQ